LNFVFSIEKKRQNLAPLACYSLGVLLILFEKLIKPIRPEQNNQTAGGTGTALILFTKPDAL